MYLFFFAAQPRFHYFHKNHNVINIHLSFQRLKKMIMDEYQTQQSSGFKRDQDEFQYLHQKLAHINKLVNDFDTSGKKKMVSVETQTIRVSFDPCSSKMEEIMYFEQKKDD